jgi:hypothetical protein
MAVKQLRTFPAHVALEFDARKEEATASYFVCTRFIDLAAIIVTITRASGDKIKRRTAKYLLFNYLSQLCSRIAE